ncbi:MAG: hypothetical protein EAZ42_10660 [Verrucomicrobia bacterium]|nr:MAG: hypothetical protein EAZ42_10660 [Verrucomicrobiota bacterium]
MRLTTVLFLFFISACCADEISVGTDNFTTIFKYPNKKIILYPKDVELITLLDNFIKPQKDISLLSLFSVQSRPKVAAILKDEKSAISFKSFITGLEKITPILLIINDDQNYFVITKHTTSEATYEFFHMAHIVIVDDKMFLDYRDVLATNPIFHMVETLNRYPQSLSNIKIIPEK